MASFKTKDRVRETSITTGTGSYALLGAVTGFQAFLGGNVSSGDLVAYVAEDGTNWENGIGTITAGVLARTHVLRSSVGDATPVNWGATTKTLRCDLIADMAAPRVLSKSVAGSSNVTLTQDEMRRDILIFTGALTGDIEIRVDATPWYWPAVINSTTGAFKITFIVTGQTGFILQRGRNTPAVCNGTDVVPVENAVYRKAADVASATTTVLNVDGDLVDVTGTTAITGITLEEGREVTARFTGALTLTHGASLVLPGAANITTAAGDVAKFRGYASAVVRCVSYFPIADLPGSQVKQGKHSFTIPAHALKPRASNGCAVLATSSGAAGQPDVDYLAFDGAAKEYARLMVQMPRDWDGGTITSKFCWRRASGAGAANVVWGMRALAVGDNETPVANFGSDATVTAAASTTTANFNLSSETGACTIAGTPGQGKLVFLEFFRDGASGSDTLDAVDAWLSQVTVFYNTNAKNEA